MSIPAAASNSVSPSTRTCPASGSTSPATMLSTLVLPAPEGPNSTVSPASATIRQAISVPPSRLARSRSKDMQPPARAPRDKLGGEQRAQREQHRDAGEAQHLPLATRQLQRGIDGE